MSAQGRRVAVTGAAGFVGTAVTRELLSRGNKVLAIDNFSVGTAARLPTHEALTSAHVDIRDASSLLGVFREYRPAAVVHLAAHHFIPYCVSHPAETLAVNTTGTQVVLDAASTVQCERLVFASTGDVYAPALIPHCEDDKLGSDNIYGLSKETAERLIRLWRARGAATETVIVRLFNVIGPGETNPHVLPDIISWARRGDTLRLGNTTPQRDYIHVGDAAHCLVGLLDVAPAADQTVNVGTGESWSVDHLVESLAAETGRSFTIERDPAKMRPSDRPILCADVTKLDSFLPDRPRTGIRESIRILVNADYPDLLDQL